MHNKNARKTRKKGTEEILEAIMTDDSPKLTSDTNHTSRKLREHKASDETKRRRAYMLIILKPQKIRLLAEMAEEVNSAHLLPQSHEIYNYIIE